MVASLHPLLPLFERARTAGLPLVLATVVATRGSTYQKAGARMLIAADGEYAGLLSGGCLEGDLAGHAQTVFGTGRPALVRYDNAGDDDLLWGLGSGCEGGLDIWLELLDPAANWEPFSTLVDCHEQREQAACGLVIESAADTLPAGTTIWSAGRRSLSAGAVVDGLVDRHAVDGTHGAGCGVVELESPPLRLFLSGVPRRHQLLLLGGGPDARPVVEFAAALGWRVTVVDHRPAYADGRRFAAAHEVLLATPGDLKQRLDLAAFDAAVVMTHHLATDLAALALLATTTIPYVGLLGPAARRQRLLADLGAAQSARFGARLHAPVGLDLGGRDPASLALAIVAEIQAHLHGRGARHPLGNNTAGADLHVMLLAAGASSRFGAPKQLADLGGQPLVARAVATLTQLERRHPVVVVLGAHAERIEPLVRGESVRIAGNPEHAQGISTSIRAGLALAPVAARGVLIALADQVAVTTDDLRRLVEVWQAQPDRIVAAAYAGTVGAPAIFPADLFDELNALQGDRGARAVLERHRQRVMTVPMPAAAHDVDRPCDLQPPRPA